MSLLRRGFARGASAATQTACRDEHPPAFPGAIVPEKNDRKHDVYSENATGKLAGGTAQ
jgi:hypothetical protein